MEKVTLAFVVLLVIGCIVMAIGISQLPTCENNNYYVLQNKATDKYMFLEHKGDSIYYSGEKLEVKTAQELLTKLKEDGWVLDTSDTRFIECSEEMHRVRGMTTPLELQTILLLEFHD
jgi:hypothetical protein